MMVGCRDPVGFKMCALAATVGLGPAEARSNWWSAFMAQTMGCFYAWCISRRDEP